MAHAVGDNLNRFLRAAELLRPRTLSNLATQLRAILRADLDYDERATRFHAIANSEGIAKHVRKSVARATTLSPEERVLWAAKGAEY